MTDIALPWYDRLYVWTRVTVLKENKENVLTNKTNTCKYLRTLFLTLPLIMTIYAVYIGAMLFVAGMLAVWLWNANWSWDLVLYILTMIGFLIGCIIGACLIVVGLIYSLLWIAGKFNKEDKEVKIVENRFQNWMNNSPFWQRFIMVMKDYHDKVCTEFTIVK